jgi:hypothetical protein
MHGLDGGAQRGKHGFEERQRQRGADSLQDRPPRQRFANHGFPLLTCSILAYMNGEWVRGVDTLTTKSSPEYNPQKRKSRLKQ